VRLAVAFVLDLPEKGRGREPELIDTVSRPITNSWNRVILCASQQRGWLKQATMVQAV